MSLFATAQVAQPSNQTSSASISASNDITPFLITAAANATLPLTGVAGYGGLVASNRAGGQGIAYIKNLAASTANVTIVATSGDTLFGTVTVAPGQMVQAVSDGQGVWYCNVFGGSGPGQLVRIQQTCPVTAFTDGGSTSGTLVLANTIPAGVVYARTLFSGLVGFTGDVSATATLGDGSDVDRYNTGTPNFFVTAAPGVDAGVPSGTLFHSAAIATVTLTVTSNSDFTLVKTAAAGVVVVTQFYYSPF